ncbi:hypothetical protein DMENIID0001_050460 [Sergentomyia squamirostris]
MSRRKFCGSWQRHEKSLVRDGDRQKSRSCAQQALRGRDLVKNFFPRRIKSIDMFLEKIPGAQGARGEIENHMQPLSDPTRVLYSIARTQVRREVMEIFNLNMIIMCTIETLK